ncbi:(2Fe-2S) ferredoxin domain-containing protein [Thermoanaerobacterium sp. DL9XJH110]|jgi:NADH:ubiquinone oxidoreductase subunit E|uniref:(2Fe-2S) ferredoxin domain-containing protein n=1 Tax=Thermoanaerobacterium sp. DL9XJH110 TaxID=3386643 RepID=UPI003BB56FD2
MKTVSVCVGSSCHLRGSYDVIRVFERLIKEFNLEHEVELKAEFCCGNCTNPVSVKVNGEGPFSIDREKAEEFFKEKILGGMQWG